MARRKRKASRRPKGRVAGKRPVRKAARRASRKASSRKADTPKKRSRPKTSNANTKKKGGGKKAAGGKAKGKGKGGKKLSAPYRNIGRDLASASEVANKYLDLDPLSQVDASRTAETQGVLNNYNALADPTSAAYAGRRTPEMQQFMQRYQDSTQGYNSRELEGLREQRRREMERGFQSGRASLARQQNNAQTGGTARAAQMLELSKSYGQSGADAENDLFVRGADEKQRRLEGYGTFAQGLGQQEFDRGQLARESYANALKQSQDDQLERNKINLGQEAASKAIQTGGVMGVLGIGESRKNAKKQNDLIRDVNNRSGSSSSGSGGGGNQAISDLLNDRADELEAQAGG